jgi:TetR/AcrR family transcriptional regulator
MCPKTAERTRDAERSRTAILEAAEASFSEHGYDAASLNDIGAAAGLSRGTPSYFFGSKERLYVEVLDRAFRARQEATEAAFAPVRAWTADDGDLDALRRALQRAAADYIRFLVEHPSFVRLVMREELAGGKRMAARTETSTAMRDAFRVLRRQAGRGGLRAFDVDDAVLLFVSLTFAPVSYRNTLMRAVDRDLTRPAVVRRQGKLVVDQLMHLLTDTS